MGSKIGEIRRTEKDDETMRTASRLYQQYMHQLKTHGMRTNMLTGGIIVGFSDAFAQFKVEERDDYDEKRGARLMSYTVLIGAPLNTVWTLGIERRFPGTALFRILKFLYLLKISENLQ